MSAVPHLLPNCVSSALKQWLQPGFNLPFEGLGGSWTMGGAEHHQVFSGLHWLCSQSSGLQMLPWGCCCYLFLQSEEEGRWKIISLQKCANPHSRAIIFLNKVNLSSGIPVAQNMSSGLCLQINSNKEKNAVLLTVICQLSWPITPPHLLGCIFQTLWEDTCLLTETEFQECQQNVYYDYLLTL